MDKILTYTLREEDLASTAGGLVNLILKNCVRVTGHEISAAKFLPDGITVDGRLVHVSERIRPGQTLRVVLPEEQEEEKILPASMPGGGPEILYEDDDIIAVNKPAGIVSHPSPGHYADSMANYLAGLLQERGERMTCRLVGRLDKETSGVLVFAKSRAACARLFRERQEGVFQRTYLAVVHGTFPENQREGTIDSHIAPVPGVLMLRQITQDGSGDRAVTHYRVLEERSLDGLSLVECHIVTGRTHQIRVQMAGIGHPLVGDTLYGPDAPTPGPDGHVKSMALAKMAGDRHAISVTEAENTAGGNGRPMTMTDKAGDGHWNSMMTGRNEAEPQRALLHAVQVQMRQPFTGESITVRSPLPAVFCAGSRCRHGQLMV